ncbi:MAG: hypothetical protein UX75_C0009G0016 [Candidatus Moranbacteria bacterium GW2011_GWE2_47_10]|nr:MAG: hypothetical protein UX75_C0009G0016 [Candidatus Moranbacteria bacterium GW2011_GWE2_47_10]
MVVLSLCIIAFFWIQTTLSGSGTYATDEPLMVQNVGHSTILFSNDINSEILFILATDKKNETVLIQDNSKDKDLGALILSLKHGDLFHAKLFCKYVGVHKVYALKEITVIPSGRKYASKLFQVD